MIQEGKTKKGGVNRDSDCDRSAPSKGRETADQLVRMWQHEQPDIIADMKRAVNAIAGKIIVK